MSSATGLINKLNEGVRTYLPETSYNGRLIGQCSSLSLLSFASIKNVPHALLGAKGVDGYSSWISSRITFLEAGSMCVVSMGINLIAAISYTILNIGTLALFKGLRNRCKIHWMHSTYAVMSTVIATVGVVKPKFGVGLNVLLLMSILRDSKAHYRKDADRFEGDFVKFVQETTKEFKSSVYEIFKLRSKGNLETLEKQKYSLEYIEAKIHSASKMVDLENLVIEIIWKWPKMGPNQ